MKVVYHCYGGAHASPTAAAIHLGHLPDQRRPSFCQIRNQPFFDEVTSHAHGHLIKVGTDSWGNEIYILGRRSSAKLVINLIKEFTRLEGGDPSEYFFVNCVQLYNILMVAGGFSSRGLGWVRFGRPIVTFGTFLSYPVLVSIVRRTIRELKQLNQTQTS